VWWPDLKEIENKYNSLEEQDIFLKTEKREWTAKDSISLWQIFWFVIKYMLTNIDYMKWHIMKYLIAFLNIISYIIEIYMKLHL
jgi:hypothetical protein